MKYITWIYIDPPGKLPVLIKLNNNRNYIIDYCKNQYKQKYINKKLTENIN